MKTPITSKLHVPKLRALTLAALAVLPAVKINAADIFWTGPTASYTNAANWSTATVPGAADNAYNDNGAANKVQINVGDPDWSVNDLAAASVLNSLGAIEQNGQTVTVGSWLHIGWGTNSVGSYTLNDGILNVLNGRLFLGEAPGADGTFVMNGGVLNKSGDFLTISDGGWNGSGTRVGTFTQAGGLINCTSEFHVGNIQFGVGTYNLSAGTNNVSNWFAVGRFGGTGNVNMSGGRINKTGGGNFYFGEGVGTAQFDFTGGVVDINSEFWLGNGGTSMATQNMSGTAIMSVGNWIAVGRGGTGILNLSGNAAITKVGGGNVVIPGSGLGIINQSGGSFTVSSGEIWLPENGNGTWNMSGGVATVGVVHICQNGGSVGVLNLDGGTFNAAEITTGNVGGFSTLNLNGGVIGATANNANFLHDLTLANVGVGGAIFNTAGFNVTVAQSLLDNGGGLTKNGAGTLTLTGANSYSGNTVVNAGKLATTTASTTPGSITLADNTSFGLTVHTANAQLTASSFTVSGPTAATFDLNLGNFGNPTAAPINVTGVFDVNGTVTVNIADDLPQIGQFPLVQYGSRTGSGNFVVGAIPVGVVANIVTNGNNIELNITSVNLPRWDGNAGGNWDIGLTANWVNIGNSLPTTYGQGNFVLFDDNATGTTTVNLTTTVNPGSVTVNNTNAAYTLVGSGKISGSIGFTKTGAGTFAIHNTGGNNYTGATVISNGVLSVTNLANGGIASPIGASSASPTNLVIGNGTLQFTGAATTVNRGVTLSSANSAIDVATDLTLSGTISPAGGRINKTGAGLLTYTGSGSNLISANINPGLQVINGTLVFNGSGIQTNRVQQDAWIGSTPAAGGSLALTNTYLHLDAWLGVGRGNGNSGNVSSLHLHNSTLTANGISFGWWNNLVGNLASQNVTLSGTSTLTNRGGNTSNVGESGGSTTFLNILDNSVFGSNPRLVIAGGGEAGAGTGTVTVANSGRLHVNNFMSIGNGNSRVGNILVKDSGTVYVQTDFNVSDTGTSTGNLALQDNAVANGLNVYIGKAGGAVGNVNITGGTLVSRATGQNSITLAQSSGSIGNVTMSGGTVACSGELFVGSSGTGTWNQTAGNVLVTNWIAIGRNHTNATGTYNISGGSLVEMIPGSRTIVGVSGTGFLNISGTAQVSSAGTLQLGEVLNLAANPGQHGKGTVNLDGGTLTVPQITRGAGLGTFNFNGGTLVAANNANATFMNNLTAANVLSGGAIINVGTNNLNIGQALLDGTGGGGLTKNGTGTLRLNGVNTYTGATLVNAGTLAGTGTIAGSVSVVSGATLAPGVSSIGTLTINGAVSLAGGSTNIMELSKNASTNDLVTGATSITYGGTLVLKNLGGVLAVNDTFKLFNAASYGGSFSAVVSQVFGQIVTWDTSNLNVDGTVRVASVVAAPVTMTAVVSGNNLDLSWPVDQLGWRLEVQTNGLTVGINTNWFTVANSTSTTAVSVPVVSGNPTVFYRLVYP